MLSVGEQLARARACYPHFRSGVHGKRLWVQGDIRPTEMSATYCVRIEYEAGEPPDVRVLSPALVPREPGGALPHVYPGDRLCLYLPGGGEWTPGRPLAALLVPWASEWLFFYELWHATGEWLGGGVEPQSRRPIRTSAVGPKASDDERAE